MKISRSSVFINMIWKECKSLLIADYKRIGGGKNNVIGVIANYFKKESLQITFWFRIGSYLATKHNFIAKVCWGLVKLIYKHKQHLTGIQLLLSTKIGGGLQFFHYNCIIIAQSVVIGRNVSIHQGVTIGRVFAGKNAGVPTIGDNVVIFAGAKLLGRINIGDNAVIGANAVVIKDVPANCVVAGAPAKVISEDSRKCFNKQWGEVFAHEYYE